MNNEFLCIWLHDKRFTTTNLQYFLGFLHEICGQIDFTCGNFKPSIWDQNEQKLITFFAKKLKAKYRLLLTDYYFTRYWCNTSTILLPNASKGRSNVSSTRKWFQVKNLISGPIFITFPRQHHSDEILTNVYMEIKTDSYLIATCYA